MAKGESYEEFVDKFKPKLTTDDCYTPDPVYNKLLEMVTDRYNLQGKQVIELSAREQAIVDKLGKIK